LKLDDVVAKGVVTLKNKR